MQATAGLASAAVVIAAVVAFLPPAPQPTVSAPSGVTFAQYESAYDAVAACMRDHGYQVMGPWQFGRDPEAGLSLGLGGELGEDPTLRLGIYRVLAEGENTEDGAKADRVWAQCESDADLEAIETAWFKANEPHLLPFDVWLDNLLACMRDHGSIPPFVEEADLTPWPEASVDITDAHLWIRDHAGHAITEYGCRPWEGR